MNGIVYGLYCACEKCVADTPEEIRYVGVTIKTLHHRFRAHLSDVTKGMHRAKDNWMRKHGPDNIQIVSLEGGIGTIEDLRVAEVAWISKMNTFGTGRGLNMTRGGEGVWGYKFSDEVRAFFRERTASQMSEKHPRAKLTEADVLVILDRIWAGETTSEIARDYSVAAASVQKIRSGQNWPHVPRPEGTPPKVLGARKRSTQLSETLVRTIWDEHTGEWGELKRLSEKYGVSESMVSLIVNGHRGLPAKLVE